MICSASSFFPRGIGCLPWFAPPPDSLSGGGAENSALMVFSELRRQKIDIEFIATQNFLHPDKITTRNVQYCAHI
jgi:hypothetical protein